MHRKQNEKDVCFYRQFKWANLAGPNNTANIWSLAFAKHPADTTTFVEGGEGLVAVSIPAPQLIYKNLSH